MRNGGKRVQLICELPPQMALLSILTCFICFISYYICYQIYCYGIEAGDAEIWQFMFEKYKSETVAAEKKRLMLSLACTKEPWILKK